MYLNLTPVGFKSAREGGQLVVINDGGRGCKSSSPAIVVSLIQLKSRAGDRGFSNHERYRYGDYEQYAEWNQNFHGRRFYTLLGESKSDCAVSHYMQRQEKPGFNGARKNGEYRKDDKRKPASASCPMAGVLLFSDN